MDVSNKTLAIFLVAAIVVSIAGTFVSLNRLGKMGGMTGYALDDTGLANLSISTSASIRFEDGFNTTDFGTGSIPNASSVCFLSTTAGPTAECSGFAQGGPLIIENDGNVNLTNVSLNSTNSAAAFIGSCGSFTPEFLWNFTQNESTSCNAGYWAAGDYMAVNTTLMSICEGANAYNYVEDHDSIRIDFLLNISSDCTPGAKTNIINLVGTQ
ncbi:MAG: hypothetical protein V1725_01985 [archaeon]